MPVDPAQQASRSQSIAYQGFDPDDMEFDMDQSASAPSSGAPSPPDTPISTPGYPSPTSYSAVPSPHGSQPASPISAFDTTTVLPSRAHHSAALGGFRSSVGAGAAGSAVRAEDAFNAYGGYSDYSSFLPGAAPVSGANAMFMQQQGLALGAMGAQSGQAVCAPTALLLSSSTGNTPDSTPASSRVASPSPGGSGYRAVAPNAHASSSNANAGASTSSGAGASGSTARASSTLSRPAASLLLSKPFKCPKANCNKSYKQANGLKYHMTHGSCNFAPPKDLEHLQELLASKRSEKARAAGEAVSESDVTLSESELREVEKEAERLVRPYACGVGECQRRYKNMNGLSEPLRSLLSATQLIFRDRVPLPALGRPRRDRARAARERAARVPAAQQVAARDARALALALALALGVRLRVQLRAAHAHSDAGRAVVQPGGPAGVRAAARVRERAREPARVCVPAAYAVRAAVCGAAAAAATAGRRAAAAAALRARDAAAAATAAVIPAWCVPV